MTVWKGRVWIVTRASDRKFWLAQNSFPNPSTARCTSCLGGTNAQLTRRQALMVGYWVNPPTSFKMQGRLVQNCVLNPTVTVVLRRNECFANPPPRPDGRVLGGLCRLHQNAKLNGPELCPEFFHTSDRDLCQWAESSANT
ncbi:hypothetical protein TNCT_160811 [Trichonephila clavata]|uniref:Uncharacterized protein n=1 Tax=Trichonephila clavata TaxID=2740835 RepID=A0A8X6F224_TRICU|nr:hypothetical protein TNCT_160811 [Trichonephila clavata]